MKKNVFLIMLVLTLGCFDVVFAMETSDRCVVQKYGREELLGLRKKGSPLSYKTVFLLKKYEIFNDEFFKLELYKFCYDFIIKYFGLIGLRPLKLFRQEMEKFFSEKNLNDLFYKKRLHLFGLRNIIKKVFGPIVNYDNYHISCIFFVLVKDLVEFFERKYYMKCDKGLINAPYIHNPRFVLFFDKIL